MISRKYRFHGYGSLNYLYRHGQTARSKMMAVRFVPNAHRDLPRFAIVISKKVHKSAAKRNKIRRRIYEVIRLSIQPNSPTIDMAITVYSPDVIDLSNAKLKKQVHELLTAAGFMK